MAYNAKVYRLLIASPGDVEKERVYITKALQAWNATHSEDRRIVLLDLKWESNSTPYYGDRPQAIINRDIVDKADCLVGVFWTRLGSPTGVDVSGTVEEIKRTHKANKPVLLYFSKIPVDPESIDTTQLNSVRDFKKELYQQGLLDTYSSFDEFTEKFNRHLNDVVLKLSQSTVEEKVVYDERIEGNEIQKENVESISDLLDHAEKAHANSPFNFLVDLKSLVAESNKDGFIQKLKESLDKYPLSENDFITIVKMCRDLGILEHTIAVLKYATQQHPNSRQLQLALIDAYDNSTDPSYRNQGLDLIEKYLSVKRIDDNPVSIDDTAHVDETALGILFNYYFKSDHPDWVVSITNDLLRRGNTSPLLLRNNARALQMIGALEEAELAFKTAIETYPKDDALYVWYGDFLDDQNRFDEAYRNTEMGIISDPEDPSGYVNLAIQILNRGLVRDEEGKIIGPVTKEERLRHALPFFLQSIRLGGHGMEEKIISILVRADAINEAKNLVSPNVDNTNFITDSYDYVNKQIESHNKSMQPTEEAAAD